MAETAQLILLSDASETRAGNYFVSNYPPYSFWKPEYTGEARAALERAPAPGTPLGVYLHIPFCRKRCHFCYFRVYTDKNSQEIQRSLDAAIAAPTARRRSTAPTTSPAPSASRRSTST